MAIPTVRRLFRLPRALWLSMGAFRWARNELARLKDCLPADGVSARAVIPPAGLAPRGHRGVDVALRSVSPSCLERALVLQAWNASLGRFPDVAIGVRKGGSAVEAHAWVDGTDPDPWFDPSYEEITRLSWR